MKNNTHHQRDTLHHSASTQNTGLSMMAVQELLGLFTEHQTYASRTLAASGKANTGLQAVFEKKPLSYV
jgi:hypothetical protein